MIWPHTTRCASRPATAWVAPAARRFTGAAALLTAVALIAAPGCASSRPEDAMDDLRRLAQREPAGAARATPQAPPPAPPGLDPALTEPATGERATRSTAEIALRIGAREPEEAPAAPEVSPERRTRALKLYASGRSALLEGDAPRAVDLLTDASELDPSSASVWRALGEAQIASGAGAMAGLSLERAVALGGGDAAAWELLGSESLRAGDWEEAVARFIRAKGALAPTDEPLLGNLIDVQLAEALRRRGYERAAMETLRRAIDLPQLTNRSTRYAAEISALYRRRGDYWIDVGDMACRLGHYEEAAEAYARGAAMPRLSLEPVLPKIVYAWVAAGAPNRAALAIVEAIKVETTGAAEDLIGLIKFTAEHGASRTAISRAVASIAGTSEARTPSRRSTLARLRASALPPDEAIDALTEGLEQAPDDARLVYEIYLHAETDRSAGRLAADLAGRNPMTMDLHAAALLETGRTADGLLAELGASRTERLLGARLRLAAGDKAEALSLLRSVDLAGADTGELMQAGEVAAACGAWDIVDESLALLADPADGEHAPLARARVLAAAQRFEGAADVIEPLLSAPSAPADAGALVFAADLLALLDRTEDAESLLLEARRLDPGDHRPHARLVDLYLSTQSPKLAEAAREIRVSLPESRLLRRLRARELSQFGQDQAALEELDALLDARPPDPQTFLLIGAILERGARETGQAVSYVATVRRIAERLADMTLDLPDVPFVRAAAVRALSADGRHEEAVELAALSKDDAALRAAERAVRLGLNDPDRARAMARERLESPARSIGDTLELAAILAADAEIARAAELVRNLPEGAELVGQQRDALRTVIALSTARAFETSDQADAEGALALIAWAIHNHPPLDAAVHQARIDLIALADPQTRVERLLQAIADASTHHAEARTTFINRATVQLRALQDGSAIRFASGLPAIAPTTPAPDGTDQLLDALTRWTVEVWTGGDVSDLRALVADVAARFRLADLIAQLIPDPQFRGEPSRAELAYLVAGAAASLGRYDQAIEMYRFVLELNPEHALALNDLGYFLITERDDVDGAETMLERAFELRGDDASVVDSLGWLRYKQNELHDYERAGVEKLGAITLLTRAKALQPDPGRRPNPNILEHLGDALWASGAREEAAEEWAAALRAARLRRRDQAGASESMAAELRDQIVRLSQKIAATNRGEPPEIAPRRRSESEGADSVRDAPSGPDRE